MRIFLLSIVCINFLLAIFVFFQNPKNNKYVLFSIMGLLASVWTFANYKIHYTLNLYWIQSSYSIGSLLITAGLMWTLLITGKSLGKKQYIVLIFLAITFFLLPFTNGFLPDYFYYLSTGYHYKSPNYIALILYTLYYLISGGFIIKTLYYSQANAANEETEKQFLYILIGASITLSTTLLNSFIFPIFSIYLTKGIDSFGFLCFLLLVTYAITKHNLFSIKTVAVQIITFLLWLFLLIRVIISPAEENIFIFVFALAIGIILIRSVIQIVKQREQIDQLSQKLDKYQTGHIDFIP